MSRVIRSAATKGVTLIEHPALRCYEVSTKTRDGRVLDTAVFRSRRKALEYFNSAQGSNVKIPRKDEGGWKR